MALNGNLCDTFEHMKKPSKDKQADEVDNMGRVRTLAKSSNLSHIACGDKCGYIWVLDQDTLNILNIFESHTDQIVCMQYSPTYSDQRGYLLATGS